MRIGVTSSTSRVVSTESLRLALASRLRPARMLSVLWMGSMIVILTVREVECGFHDDREKSKVQLRWSPTCKPPASSRPFDTRDLSSRSPIRTSSRSLRNSEEFYFISKARAEAFEQFPTQAFFEYRLKVCHILL